MGSWWVPNDWHERRSASGRWTARSESQRSSRRAEVPVAADLRSGQEPCPTGKATPTPLRRPRPATRSRGRREIQRVQPHANERQGSRGKSAPRADPRPVRTRHGRRPEGPAARMPFATVANPARRHHRCCQGRAATARRWTARPRTTPSITEQPSRESSRHCSLRRDPAVLIELDPWRCPRAAAVGVLARAALGGTSVTDATVEAEAPRIERGATAGERRRQHIGPRAVLLLPQRDAEALRAGAQGETLACWQRSSPGAPLGAPARC